MAQETEWRKKVRPCPHGIRKKNSLERPENKY